MEKGSLSRQVSDWCQSMPAATCGYPFGDQAAVFKVGGKMFALVTAEGPPEHITLKADPSDCEALRAQYESVRPGYYMNKRHWITIDLAPAVAKGPETEDATDSPPQHPRDSPPEVPMQEVHELIQESHRLVVAGLPKRVRVELGLEETH